MEKFLVKSEMQKCNNCAQTHSLRVKRISLWGRADKIVRHAHTGCCDIPRRLNYPAGNQALCGCYAFVGGVAELIYCYVPQQAQGSESVTHSRSRVIQHRTAAASCCTIRLCVRCRVWAHELCIVARRLTTSINVHFAANLHSKAACAFQVASERDESHSHVRKST